MNRVWAQQASGEPHGKRGAALGPGRPHGNSRGGRVVLHKSNASLICDACPLQEQMNIQQGILNTEGNGTGLQLTTRKREFGFPLVFASFCGNSTVSPFNIRHSLLDILRFQTRC